MAELQSLISFWHLEILCFTMEVLHSIPFCEMEIKFEMLSHTTVFCLYQTENFQMIWGNPLIASQCQMMPTAY